MSTGAPSLTSPSTLVGLLWPSRDDARFAALRALVLMMVGTALLTVSGTFLQAARTRSDTYGYTRGILEPRAMEVEWPRRSWSSTTIRTSRDSSS